MATLFAALNMLDGTVLGNNMQRHRHQKFIRFLNKIERTIPASKAIHAIVDLQTAINQFIAKHNTQEAKPFIWKAKPKNIIGAVNRGFQTLESIY